MSVVFEFLAANPVLLIFLLVGLGAAVGRVSVGGVSLGAVAVLFAAIGLTAWSVAVGVPIEVPAAIGDIGLVIFAFCTGLIAGPGFFNALRTSYPLMLVVAGVLVLSAVAAFLLGGALGLDPVTIAGTFAGATTNTPALAATGGSPAATVGYASAYVFGVIGAMAAAALALRHRPSDTDAMAPIVEKPVQIDTTTIHTVGEIVAHHSDRVAISRIKHADDGQIDPVRPDTELEVGDVINVVGPRDEVDEVAIELGHTSAIDITRERSSLDFRRIILSNPKLAGRTIGGLRLHEQFGASIARIRRGDVEFVATDDFVLHQGDRLRVVGPRDAMADLTSFFGDSERGMADVNPLALGLGIAIGLGIGAIQIPIPGGHFSLGYAAGALLLGLVMGRIGRIGPIVTSLPHTAASVLAEYGLLVFLAFAGTKAGSLIVSAIVSGEVLTLLLLGFVVTSIAMFGTYLVGRFVFRLGGTRLSGVVGGAQTNPAILAFANLRTDYDVRVALGYSLVYPAAMVVKILLAQIMVGL
ncbi:hypothetical protein ET445_11580 [Agromyces protaetiae]|uniref:RCK C-terminal domain-containing protein n=1 Tax=Agromyces protaetiae TaxID=2509455 RepID=A0A4V0YH91_9MICO|nr:TrkA C-terminal domain-containing protein [Agromyces protaetiae]QAY73891.1 hypothetical protein ET445_11580 [Agromyces protaetiae]